MPLVTLTTDFGTVDGYVGVVKGVMHSINPAIQLVDITHEISSWNIGAAAWVIWNTYRFYPPGTIHLCVVDPMVGSTGQRQVAITNGRDTFVGPDNGIFSRVLDSEEEQLSTWQAFALTKGEFWLPHVSSTFHTRDIYGPICAHLSCGATLEQVGDRVELSTLARLKPLVPSLRQGHVVHIDKFGNLITNIVAKQLQAGDRCFLNERLVARLISQTYSSETGDSGSDETKIRAVVGSHGYLEIGAYQARAVDVCGASIGDAVRLEPAC